MTSNVELMTTRELAARWRRGEKWIREQAHAKEIPAIRIGSQWRFDPDDIADFENRHKTLDRLALSPLSAKRQNSKERRAL